MRAERAAALTNFLLILLIAGSLMVSSGQANVAHVYSRPTTAVFQAAATVLLVLALVVTPLAAFVSWRTLVHVRRLVTREGTGRQGIVEAGAVGFALTLPFVLPGVVARQFNPGQWGQPQAFILGLGYVGVYGLLGLVAGLAVGLLLWASARLVLCVHRRIAS